MARQTARLEEPRVVGVGVRVELCPHGRDVGLGGARLVRVDGRDDEDQGLAQGLVALAQLGLAARRDDQATQRVGHHLETAVPEDHQEAVDEGDDDLLDLAVTGGIGLHGDPHAARQFPCGSPGDTLVAPLLLDELEDLPRVDGLVHVRAPVETRIRTAHASPPLILVVKVIRKSRPRLDAVATKSNNYEQPVSSKDYLCYTPIDKINQ